MLDCGSYFMCTQEIVQTTTKKAIQVEVTVQQNKST